MMVYKKPILGVFILSLVGISLLVFRTFNNRPIALTRVTLTDVENLKSQPASDSSLKTMLTTPAPTPTPSPSPTPTARPLTFAEMNQLYGPCAVLPTLMYHHIQNEAIAKQLGHAQLTVDTNNFRKQMQYLKEKGYTIVTSQTLIDFFNKGTAVPKRSVLLTFDDGYDDFATDAAPILKEFGYPATLFVPTGLMENSGYLHWSTIKEIAATQPILMANHTWSHHSMGGSRAMIEKEISTADTQLAERNLNSPKTFAYPYGSPSNTAANYLQTLNYQIAFTTTHGSTLCAKQRFFLPRIRIGNAQLSAYGL